VGPPATAGGSDSLPLVQRVGPVTGPFLSHFIWANCISTHFNA